MKVRSPFEPIQAKDPNRYLDGYPQVKLEFCYNSLFFELFHYIVPFPQAQKVSRVST